MVVFVEWGAEVEESKKLIHELGLDKYFEWVAPMPKMDLLRAYFSVDCVIDQFILPCLGSITLEAIAVGNCPVITRLDDIAMNRFFGRTIPLLNCVDDIDISKSMLLVLEDKNRAKLIGLV